jgi:hypothetical protein
VLDRALVLAEPWLLASALWIAAAAFGSNVVGAQAPPHARVWLVLGPSFQARGCTLGDVHAAVEARLGRALGASGLGDADLTLTGGVETSPSGSAEVVLRLEDGRRELLGVRRIPLDDLDCTTLVEGLPLIIAMLVDLHEHDASVHLGGQERPWRFGIDVGVGLDVGWLPVPAVLPGAGAMLAPGGSPVSLVVRASFVVPQQADVVRPGRMQVLGAAFAIGGCAEAELAPTRLGGCALIEAGYLRIEGLGFDIGRASDAFHLGAVALGSLEVLLGPVALRLELGASVPWVRQEVTFDDVEGRHVVFSSAPVGFRAALFAGTRLE